MNINERYIRDPFSKNATHSAACRAKHKQKRDAMIRAAELLEYSAACGITHEQEMRNSARELRKLAGVVK